VSREYVVSGPGFIGIRNGVEGGGVRRSVWEEAGVDGLGGREELKGGREGGREGGRGGQQTYLLRESVVGGVVGSGHDVHGHRRRQLLRRKK